MKLVLMLTMLIGLNAYAEQKAPAPFTDSQIKRTLKDGTVQTFDGDEFVIVPRKPKKKVTPVAPKAPEVKTVEVIKTVEVVREIPPKKNRVSLLAGAGPVEGLNRYTAPNTVTVESRVGAIFGLQYQRLLTDKISVGAQVQTNSALLLDVGLDF